MAKQWLQVKIKESDNKFVAEAIPVLGKKAIDSCTAKTRFGAMRLLVQKLHGQNIKAEALVLHDFSRSDVTLKNIYIIKYLNKKFNQHDLSFFKYLKMYNRRQKAVK